MTHFKSLFMLFMALGLVAVAVQGYFRGWLPNGPQGYKQGKGVSREEQPLGFWFFFALYFFGGIAMAIYALRLLLAGGATPLH